jgi:hypothetical protein
VSDFDGVAGVEIHLDYDESCVDFDSVQAGYLVGATTNGGDGAVHIIWEDFGNPLTLADGENLAQVCFTNIAAGATEPCAVTFAGTCELANELGEPVPFTTQDGSVACHSECCLIRGDVNHSGELIPDISDLIYMAQYAFLAGPDPVCLLEADVNNSGGPIDISDIIYLVQAMFQAGPAPVPCP